MGPFFAKRPLREELEHDSCKDLRDHLASSFVAVVGVIALEVVVTENTEEVASIASSLFVGAGSECNSRREVTVNSVATKH